MWTQPTISETRRHLFLSFLSPNFPAELANLADAWIGFVTEQKIREWAINFGEFLPFVDRNALPICKPVVIP